MSNSLWPHELQHTRLPCPSLSPGVCSDSSPLNWLIWLDLCIFLGFLFLICCIYYFCSLFSVFFEITVFFMIYLYLYHQFINYTFLLGLFACGCFWVYSMYFRLIIYFQIILYQLICITGTLLFNTCYFWCFLLVSSRLKGRRQWHPHSITLAWQIPWTEEPGRLQSMGSWRVRQDRMTSLSLFTFMHWRRKWQPTPVFLPGESRGQESLVGCCLWGRTESDMTEAT